jgi:hypothetical protein
MKRVRRWFALVIVGSGLFAAAPVDAFPPPNVWKNFANENFCLDIAGSNSNQGANLVVFQCNGTLGQSWAGEPYPHDTSAEIFRSQLNTNLVFGVAAGSTNNGANLVTWPYNGSADQAWRPVFVSNDASGHQCFYFQNLKAKQAGLTRVAGVAGGVPNIKNGTNIILWDRNASNDQVWCQY